MFLLLLDTGKVALEIETLINITQLAGYIDILCLKECVLALSPSSELPLYDEHDYFRNRVIEFSNSLSKETIHFNEPELHLLRAATLAHQNGIISSVVVK